MPLLLDSHAFVWFDEGNPRISRPARAAIEENAEEVWVSYASIWELTIKQAVSRMTLPEAPEAMATSPAMMRAGVALRLRMPHMYNSGSAAAGPESAPRGRRPGLAAGVSRAGLRCRGPELAERR